MKAKLFSSSLTIRRPTQTHVARWLLAALLISLALTLGSSTADAHGIGYYQIRGAPMDPYVVHVWIAPGVLRTGDVHIDTAVFDTEGKPALGVLVRVSFIPLDSEIAPLVSMAGSPALQYPHGRGASFRLETPGKYRLEVAVSDSNGPAGVASADVEVKTVGWPIKVAIATIFVGSAASGVWMIFLTRAFWMRGAVRQQSKLHRLVYKVKSKSFVRGGTFRMSDTQTVVHPLHKETLIQRLNGTLHAPALWIFMIIIVAHWLEHVLQIYQIYGLGWAPASAGGILGVMYPQLVESETLHFVYDFIQWAGIVILRLGFRGRAATFWTIAMIIQTWHYIEHVLLMGQYLTGYYLFGAPHQISILQLWFPRAELHFTYNLLVFIPMVIAVHYYIKPKLEMIAALNKAALEEQANDGERA